MQNETPDFPTRLAACARQLRRHGFEAVCVADLAEAGRRLRDEIARCAPRSISYGDSMTLRATGIVEELRNGSRYEFIDGFDPALPRPEQLEVRRKGLLADFFMTGVNAVTLGGSLYWVDMVGNRTAPVIFGPRRVVLLAGRNKIVDTQADAERRVQQIAGPKNVARHTGFRTPCAVTGLCADCNSPQRICNSRVWLERCYPAGRILVLLIDEVDKADLEFPNDLLWELDKMEFYIPETKETIKAKHRPIVIITSNAEKELPDAFLRRCIFHYIEFPDQQQMEKIIRVHFDHVDETLLMQAMQAFYYIRSIDSVEKKPSTSELVDWIRALELTGVDTSRITKEIPFIGVLLKKDKDISTVQRRLRR